MYFICRRRRGRLNKLSLSTTESVNHVGMYVCLNADNSTLIQDRDTKFVVYPKQIKIISNFG